MDTHDACRGTDDDDEAQALVGRVNQARAQLWRWMHDQRSDVSEKDFAKVWREKHLRSVVCGGWVQGSDGTWQGKTC